MSIEHLMDKSEARKALGGIGNTTLYKLLAEGKIEGVKVGKLTKIKPSSITQYIETLPKYGEA